MAFDGIVVANLVRDLNDKIVSGRISKIAQPEKDELILTIKGNRENIRLLISANASLPLLYFTETNKPGPLTAPNFCMLLRKHISGGRIVAVTQPGLERGVRIEVEHLDEMGDLRRKFLIVELMGKHSNIILCDDRNLIPVSYTHLTRTFFTSFSSYSWLIALPEFFGTSSFSASSSNRNCKICRISSDRSPAYTMTASPVRS